jgi:glyoxylase-like metal-dependent hydrolase (beta-lactamase superfamily II)
MRARALHSDVLVVTSSLLALNCVIVRSGSGEAQASDQPEAASTPSASPGRAEPEPETFVIDSPVLPEELQSLSALLGQARFPAPSGLLATHGDWDHLLGRLAFADLALGCAESTAKRLAAHPSEAQRELRAFDEQLAIEREAPLALGSLQALPVPGRLEVGDRELELHPTSGHTEDGMALLVGWAGVLVAGDYLSPIEIPTVHTAGAIEAYLQTLELLRGLLERSEQVVPGHGPTLDSAGSLAVLEEDVAYLQALRDHGRTAALPESRRRPADKRLHEQNAAVLDRGS